MLRHIISDFDWTKADMLKIFREAEKIRNAFSDEKNPENILRLKNCLRGKTIAILMFEPSTRTRISFEMAAKMLGMDAIICDDMRNTSVAKGESLEDTIISFASLGVDTIVMRHPEDDAAQKAADTLTKSGYKTLFINAGDGKNFHPTQGLLDMYTLWRTFGKRFVDGKVVAGICGDLTAARVTHSQIVDLSLFRIPMALISPEENDLPEDIENWIFAERTGYIKSPYLLRWANIPDFWCFCRLQTERYKYKMSTEELINLEKEYIRNFGCTNEFRILVRSDAYFLHPGPQREEFPEEAKKDPRSLIAEQVKNGKWARAALLKLLLNPNYVIEKP